MNSAIRDNGVRTAGLFLLMGLFCNASQFFLLMEGTPATLIFFLMAPVFYAGAFISALIGLLRSFQPAFRVFIVLLSAAGLSLFIALLYAFAEAFSSSSWG